LQRFDFKKDVPKEFFDFLDYSKKLRFDEKPEYASIRSIILFTRILSEFI